MSTATLPPPTSATEPAWGIRDVSMYFRITERTVFNWIKAGKIPAPVRVGSKWLWDPAVIKSLLTQHNAGA